MGRMYQAPPGYYPPQPAPPAKTTATDVIIPLVLSLFCGFGGFVWGLVRLAQGHNRPGWVAIAVNAGVWAVASCPHTAMAVGPDLPHDTTKHATANPRIFMLGSLSAKARAVN